MDDNEGSVNLIPDVSSGLLQAKPAKNIPLAKAKPSKSEWNRLLSRVANLR